MNSKPNIPGVFASKLSNSFTTIRPLYIMISTLMKGSLRISNSPFTVAES